jgi:alpha-amylase
MYLMFDVVANHMGTVGLPSNFSGLSPYSSQSDFHPFCFIDDDNNQTDVEQCWLGDSSVPLADINTEDQNIVSSLYTWVQNLVRQYQVDGLRIDTVKNIRIDFWPNFASSAGVFTLGEVRAFLLTINFFIKDAAGS